MPHSGPAAIHIGCSGWSYKHWRGRFYPEDLPVKHWFAFYASRFGAVEINNSFYRLPSPETFASWCKHAPPGFRYAVKANRFLTQAKKLKDCEEPMQRMMGSVRHLGASLGPVLYQLPPHFPLNLDRLRQFLELAPSDVAHVFEFRHPSWYVDAVFDLLDQHHAGCCVHDMAGSQSPWVATGAVGYLRFHGAEGKYWGHYPIKRLQTAAEWMLAEARQGRMTWAFFNNDIDAHAIHDATALKAMVDAQAGTGTLSTDAV